MAWLLSLTVRPRCRPIKRRSSKHPPAGGARVATAQAISFEQAVALYTSAAAEACGIDAVRGRIAPDMRADFALLDADTCRVREVYRAGERV